MTAPYEYRVLVELDVASDLKDHLSPIEVMAALKKEIDRVNEIDDYMPLATTYTLVRELAFDDEV